MYMVVAFADEADEAEEDKEEKDKEGEDKEEEDKEEEEKEEEEKEEKDKEEEGEDDDGGERPPTQWLLKQMVALSKKERSEVSATGGVCVMKGMVGRLLDCVTI